MLCQERRRVLLLCLGRRGLKFGYFIFEVFQASGLIVVVGFEFGERVVIGVEQGFQFLKSP